MLSPILVRISMPFTWCGTVQRRETKKKKKLPIRSILLTFNEVCCRKLNTPVHSMLHYIDAKCITLDDAVAFTFCTFSLRSSKHTNQISHRWPLFEIAMNCATTRIWALIILVTPDDTSSHIFSGRRIGWRVNAASVETEIKNKSLNSRNPLRLCVVVLFFFEREISSFRSKWIRWIS